MTRRRVATAVIRKGKRPGTNPSSLSFRMRPLVGLYRASRCLRLGRGPDSGKEGPDTIAPTPGPAGHCGTDAKRLRNLNAPVNQAYNACKDVQAIAESRGAGRSPLEAGPAAAHLRGRL